MAHSIESRVPFLDYRLVEFLLSLPNDYKISEGVTKRILRESMIGILPESVRTRMDKVGFVTPEEVWLKKEAPDIFRKEIKRAVYHSGGILTDYAERRLERIIDSELQFDYIIWRMICFGRWMERFNVEV
jgi:asparagine synthase (glutamine-hydrolysing)